MKTEPDCFGLKHLKAKPKRTEHWDGVRNYQARNFLRDGMQKGDLARAAYPDHTAWDPDNEHFDPKSSPANPIWCMVDVKLERAFNHPITLAALKQNPALKGMTLLQRGNRLSILPVTAKEWNTILKME